MIPHPIRRQLPWLLAAALVIGAAAGTPSRAPALEVPAAPAGRVSDYAHLLSPAAAQRIDTTIERHEAESSDQIAVAIFPSLEGESLEDFSIRLAEQWKIGTREHDNGAILLIFVEDRRSRIEVGYGLEGRLTDALSSRILRDVMAPRFRAQDFDGGVEAAVNAIIGAIKGEYQATDKPPGARSLTPLGALAAVALWLVIVLGGLMFFFLPRWFWMMVLANMLLGSKQGWSKRQRGGLGMGGWGGGGWGGGGGGGGFSGGGGSFGGGGSSGGW